MLETNAIEDLMADLVSIIYSFCSRLYGQRRAKRKTEKIVQELGNQKNNADGCPFPENLARFSLIKCP